ncbi:UPF0158 family protein [Jiangella rhizosphaerae]|nr:UPF0158 family protein [Jiangella rhizosphaerae]
MREDPPTVVDRTTLRQVLHSGDPAAIVAVVAGHDVRPALQLAGDAVLVALEAGATGADNVAGTVVATLRERVWDGDLELAEELVAVSDGRARLGEILTVELDDVADLLEGDLNDGGGYLDLQTGDTWPLVDGDDGYLADVGVDLDDEPDRWLRVHPLGSHDGWEDMAHFAAGVTDDRLRGRLDEAIHGRGAFRRFKDAVHQAGVAEQWYGFSAERRAGRARAWLAGEGIRARPRRWVDSAGDG